MHLILLLNIFYKKMKEQKLYKYMLNLNVLRIEGVRSDERCRCCCLLRGGDDIVGRVRSEEGVVEEEDEESGDDKHVGADE